jgi:hypothetical protein
MSEAGCLDLSKGKFRSFQVKHFTMGEDMKKLALNSERIFSASTVSEPLGAAFGVDRVTAIGVTMIQPPNTIIKDIILTPSETITCAAGAGNDLTFAIGTGTGIVVNSTNIMENVSMIEQATWLANTPLYLISDSTTAARGAVNSFDPAAGRGPFGGPDTSAALLFRAGGGIAGGLRNETAANRNIFVKHRVETAALGAGDTATIKTTIIYQYLPTP